RFGRSFFFLNMLLLRHAFLQFCLLATPKEPAYFFLSFLLLVFVYLFGLAPEQLDQRHLGAIAPACSKFQDACVTARPLREPRRYFVEELIERRHAGSARRLRPLVSTIRHAVGVPGEEISGGQSPIMKRTLRGIRCKRALTKRNGAFGKGPQLFCFWQRRYQPLVGTHRSAKVTQ